jgi:L-amino acid N-acyltransferase YncA
VSDHLSLRCQPHFRPARVEDSAQLAQVHLLTWQATYRGLLSARFLDELAAGLERRATVLAEALAKRTMVLWVAEVEGRIVAWASFGSSRDADATAATGELRAINLLPEVWSQGIGSGLWHIARQALIDAGHTQATVWVVQGNLRAIGFYEALGFIAEPQSATTVVEYDEPLALVRYRIALIPEPTCPARPT